jgi:hypothetical protein
MSLSPRQIAAYLEFNEVIDRQEMARDLGIAALGAQGDGKTVQQKMKELL